MKAKILVSFIIFVLLVNSGHGQGNSFLILTIEEHSNRVSSLSFSQDGKLLASGSLDNAINLLDAQTGDLVKNLQGQTSFVSSVSFSPDSKLLASSSWDEVIKLWNVKSGQLIRKLKGHKLWVNSLSFSPDGSIIASCSDDKTVRLWSTQKGTLLRTFKEHKDYVLSVSFHPKGKIVASASSDKTIKAWDIQTSRLIFTINEESSRANSIAFSPDGNILASCHANGNIKLWKAKTGDTIRTIKAHIGGVFSLAFNHLGSLLATGGFDKVIKLWDVKTGKLLRTLEGHTSSIWSLSFSPNSQILASGSDDNTIKLWNTEELLPIKILVTDYVNYRLAEPIDKAKTLISNWQQKSEFETNNEYKERIKKLPSKVESLKANLIELKETFIQDAIQYYGEKLIELTNYTMSEYNVSDETFKIVFPKTKISFILNVPIAYANDFESKGNLRFKNNKWFLSDRGFSILSGEVYNTHLDYSFGYNITKNPNYRPLKLITLGKINLGFEDIDKSMKDLMP